MELKTQIQLLRHIRYQLLCGHSTRSACENFLEKHPRLQKLRLFLETHERSQDEIVFFVIERGLRGESIAESLQDVVDELVERRHADIERRIRLIPVFSMLPVLLFMVPAYLILLLGPAISGLFTVLH